MYLAIDVGGTKTLLAVFSKTGQLLHEQKIKTDRKYDGFLVDLKTALQEEKLKQYDISAVCCALPGRLDRLNGVGIRFGNLEWQEVPIRKDLEKTVGDIAVYIENDAKLAGLYEARLLLKKYKKVVYLTLGTGIGIGIIINGKIDPVLADSEIGNMVVEHDGKLKKWEDFASGKALVERFGKNAEQLDNPFAWKTYARDLSVGFEAALAAFQPEVIVVGGGVGAHFDKFGDLLVAELKKRQNPMVPIPPIIKANRAEEAVVYGCYEFIKQNHG